MELDGIVEGELDDFDERVEGERGRGGGGRVEDGDVVVLGGELVAELGGGKEVAGMWERDHDDLSRHGRKFRIL